MDTHVMPFNEVSVFDERLEFARGVCARTRRRRRDAGLPDSALAGVTGDPRQQITSASGRVSGGGYTVEVQLGHATPQRGAASATRSTEGTTPIKP